MQASTKPYYCRNFQTLSTGTLASLDGFTKVTLSTEWPCRKTALVLIELHNHWIALVCVNYIRNYTQIFFGTGRWICLRQILFFLETFGNKPRCNCQFSINKFCCIYPFEGNTIRIFIIGNFKHMVGLKFL